MDVWHILPNLMDCEESYLRFWGVGWVGYANNWAFRNILNAYIKWNVEYSMRLINGLFYVC